MLTTYSFSIELGNFQVETVQSVSGLAVGQDVIEVKQVTSTGELLINKQPGPRQAGEVTITRGMDKSKAFTDWIKETLDKRSIDPARQNVAIAVLDPETREAVHRIQLRNAWASQWTMSDLAADGSGPATEQVTITYEEATVD